MRSNGQRRSALALALLSPLSLGLLSWVDDPIWALLRRVAPGAAWVAEARLPSLAVCLALCLALAPRMLSLRRRAPWARIALVAAAWLGPAALVLIFRHPAPFVALPRRTDVVAHLCTGLLAEELLFRGALQTLAREAFAAARLGPLPAHVLFSAALFSLSHAQYHGFHLAAALPQMGMTLGLGVALGLIADLAQGLWPAVAAHAVQNLLAFLR